MGMTKAKRMTLDEFRRICEARTKGEWQATSDFPAFSVSAKDTDVCPSKNRLYRMKNAFGLDHWGVRERDAHFIAACSVMVDPLMRVARAAKILDQMYSTSNRIELAEALAALEQQAL